MIKLGDVSGAARNKKLQPRQADYGYDFGGSSLKSGYSSGSGLRSIAQGSADHAHSIVSTQHLAANQAAYVGE